ncbi:MAG TPA: nucleotide pyrophosphohydrolase [Candidatus Bathyarchaeia archaeon]|nr:nucleotide pyrophosphohydrolase [Candidatus Bathyarchaeia archaeon]
MDNTQTVAELKRLVREFRDARNWSKLDTPRSLAISIALEAAELLEHYKWDKQPDTKDKVADELADVIIYCLVFSEALQIDVSQALTRKLQKNKTKYPVT